MPKADLRSKIRGCVLGAALGDAIVLATDDLRAREREIVENLATLEGIEREMERASRVGLLCLELGASWLYKELAKGKGFADIKVLARLRSYLSGTMRDLRELAALKDKLGKGGSALDYHALVRQLEQMR